MEFTVKEVTVLELPIFWMKCFTKYIFLELFELFNIVTVQIWTSKRDFNKGYIMMIEISS